MDGGISLLITGLALAPAVLMLHMMAAQVKSGKLTRNYVWGCEHANCSPRMKPGTLATGQLNRISLPWPTGPTEPWRHVSSVPLSYAVREAAGSSSWWSSAVSRLQC